MFKIKDGLQLFNRQTTVRYSSGNYGSFEIDGGGKGNWEGYSIGGRVVFMHANGTEWGIYNDVNNQWAVRGWFQGATELFHAGNLKLETNSGGVTVTGTLTASSLVGSINYNQISNPPSIPDGNLYVRKAGDTMSGQLTVNSNLVVTGDLKMNGTDSYIWSPPTSAGYTGLWDQPNSRLVWKYQNNVGDLEVHRPLKVLRNWGTGGVANYPEAFTIQGTYPSYTLRSTTSNSVWLQHMESGGDLLWYYGNNYADDAWSAKLELRKDGNLYYQTTNKYYHTGDFAISNYYTKAESDSRFSRVYKATKTITTSYSTIATVNGDGLASALELCVGGTSGSVVINVVAKILVNHSQDILIEADSGIYTQLKLKVTSNNNEDFAIELARVSGSGNTSVNVEIRPKNSEAVSFATSHSFTGNSLELQTTAGKKMLSTGGATYDIRTDGSVSSKGFYSTGNSYLGDGNGDTLHVNDKLFVEATDSGDSELRIGENSSGGYGLRFHWDSGHNGYFKSRHAGTDNNFLSFDTRYTHKLRLYRGLERTAHSNGYFIGSYNSVGDNATKTNPIYTIGDAYRPSDTSLSNMYGIGYCAGSAGFVSGQADNGGWGQYVAADGDARIFLSGSSGNIYAKGYNSYFGEDGSWDSATTMTRIHPQGHNQFWFGAGNGTWFTGTANSTSRHDDLCTGETNRHDTLITTMQGDSNISRGITFAAANNSAGTSGYRIGRWFAGDNSQANSILVVDGQLFAKAGNTDEFDHYGNHYDSYRGSTHWPGDQAWHKPGVVSSRALQIQSGNAGTSVHKPQLQFHHNGYGGVKLEYNGPTDVLHISGASNRLDHVQVDTHGYTDGLRINYDQVWSPSRPLHIQHTSSQNTYINCYSGGNVGIGSDSADEKLHVHGNTKVTGNVYGNLIGQNNSFTVGGDADTYYPVVLNVNDGARVQEFHIYRHYGATAPSTWNTSSHKGGLSLKFDIRSGGWGGFTNDLTVYYFGESYSRMVGGISPVNHTMQFCVWLRGGGAIYSIQSNQHFGITVYDDINSNYYSGQGWLTYNNANDAYKSYTNYKTQAQADTSCKDTIYRRMIRHADGSLPYITPAPRYEDMSLDGIKYLEVGNNQGSVYNDGSWDGRLNVSGTSHARIDTKCVTDGIITSMYAHTGHNQGRIGTSSNHSLGLMANGTVRATLDTAGNFSTVGNVNGVDIANDVIRKFDWTLSPVNVANGWVTVATTTDDNFCEGIVRVTANWNDYVDVYWRRFNQYSEIKLLASGKNSQSYSEFTAIRVLEQSSNTSGGIKLLQVFKAGSNPVGVQVATFKVPNPNSSVDTIYVAPNIAIENSKSGYVVQPGSTLESINTYSVVEQNGGYFGGDVVAEGNLGLRGTAPYIMIGHDTPSDINFLGKGFISRIGGDFSISSTGKLTLSKDSKNVELVTSSNNSSGTPTGITMELITDSNNSPGHTFMRFKKTDGTTVGSIYRYNASMIYATSSDYRLKENIRPVENAIEKLNSIQVHTFNMIDSPEESMEGFLAHELQEIIPEAVIGTKDGMTTEEYEVTPAVMETLELSPARYDEEGNIVTEAVTTEVEKTPAVMGTREVPEYQGVDQSKLTPLLTVALQEALAKIESLEARLDALENN